MTEQTTTLDAIRPEHVLRRSSSVSPIHPPRSPPSPASGVAGFAKPLWRWSAAQVLSRVAMVFYNLWCRRIRARTMATTAKCRAAGAALERDPEYAVLFDRIARLYHGRADLGLTVTEATLGAHSPASIAPRGLDVCGESGMADITERLAQLGTAFGHHLLGDEQAWSLDRVADREDCRVLRAPPRPPRRARPAGKRSSLFRARGGAVPEDSPPRPAREGVQAVAARGDTATPTTTTLSSSNPGAARGSGEAAGYPNYAAYAEDSMRGRRMPCATSERVWRPALARTLAVRTRFRTLIGRGGRKLRAGAVDWRYYARSCGGGAPT